MKVTLAQINTTPRDIQGNLDQILYGVVNAEHSGAECVVFPELSIPGYGVKDCIYDNVFVDANLEGVEQIKTLTRSKFRKDLFVVVGYIDHNHTGLPGKPYFNCAAVIKNGLTVGTYRKHLLPFYDVFDEGRYYQPGSDLLVWTMGGKKWGLIICEDGWNDKGQDDYSYEDNPLAQYRKMGITNIIAINSSPFTSGKPKRRMDMYREVSQGMTIVWVNQVGGQDELVFDGNSFIAHNGEIIYMVPDSREEPMDDGKPHATYNTVDIDELTGDIEQCIANNNTANLRTHKANAIRDTHDMICDCTGDYARKCGFKQVILGGSGGIDSALVSTIAKKVFGPKNVFALRLPTVNSSEGSKTDALQLHTNLDIHDALIPVDYEPMFCKMLDDFRKSLGDGVLDLTQYKDVAEENFQAGLRGQFIMRLSNAYGLLPLTTGNKSELALGYCTVGGDMLGGWNPIGDCYKMEVYAVSNYCNKKADRELIPQSILDKEPSAELKKNQKDTDSLLPYPILDPLLYAYIEKYITTFRDYRRWVENGGPDSLYFLSLYNVAGVRNWIRCDDAESEYLRMVGKIDWNEFKRRFAALCPKLHGVAFGTGRRLPIAKGKV